MNDVIDQLAGLGTGHGTGLDRPAPDEVVRRDLVRGRAAARRRRFRRGVTGVGAAAAVAVTALAITAGQPAPLQDPGPGTGPDPTGLDLVAYTGDQLPGFTVGKVPEGFVLQGANPYSLDIARPDDHSDINDYRGKLVVMLQSTSMTSVPAGKAVEVNGRPGTISTFDPAAAQLYYSDGDHQIVVQSDSSLGLTDEELVEFAASVRVTSEAVAAAG